MLKRTLAELLCVIMMVVFTLSGCGSTASKLVEKSFSSTDAAEVNEPDLPGTYVGVHGSGLTLLKDGKAEYYWKEFTNVDTDGNWSCSDHKMKLNLSSIGCEIQADVPDGKVTSMNLTGNIMWDDETYIRVSDDADSKSVSDYVSLIEEQLKIKLDEPTMGGTKSSEETYTPIEISKAGITFSIPGDYDQSGDSFEKNYGNCGLLFVDLGESLSDQIFKQSGTEFDDVMEGVIIEQLTDVKRVKAEASEVAGLQTRTYQFDGMMEERPITEYMEVFNIPEENKQLAFMAISGLDKYDDEMKEDFEKILSSATYHGVKTTESREKSESSSTTGLDPDMVAFLDEYETFVDNYCDLMTKYYQNPTDLTLLSEYTKMIAQLEEFSQKADQYDSSDMSAEDAAYYMEVYNRCTQKMLKVAGSMSGN